MRETEVKNKIKEKEKLEKPGKNREDEKEGCERGEILTRVWKEKDMLLCLRVIFNVSKI
jgi:hypothetical protein